MISPHSSITSVSKPAPAGTHWFLSTTYPTKSSVTSSSRLVPIPATRLPFPRRVHTGEMFPSNSHSCGPRSTSIPSPNKTSCPSSCSVQRAFPSSLDAQTGTPFDTHYALSNCTALRISISLSVTMVASSTTTGFRFDLLPSFHSYASLVKQRSPFPPSSHGSTLYSRRSTSGIVEWRLPPGITKVSEH